MARWKPAPVIGGAYSDDAKAWTCQDTLNYIPVMAERPGGRSPTMLRGVPGMRTFCITGSNKPIRGARNVEGLLLVVTGTTLYKVSTKGAATAIGTIPGVGRVSMSHNQIAGGNEVAIANGQSGYVYNTVTGTLAQITDEGFPGAISFDFIDGYITGIEPARRFAFHSNLAAATGYNTLDRYEAEGSPDKLVGQIVDHREWWLFSERTIEPFINTGAATNTFQRASNTMIEVGCASGASIVQMDSSAFWVGNDGIVYRANGYTPQRISTSALEQALARCHLAQCFAFTFEDRGHKIYYLTCPDGQTWGYDAATGEWHRRQSEGLTRWRINTLTKWNGVWIAGDYTNGKLYELNWDVQDEDHAVLERRRITGVLSDNQNRATVDGVALVFDTGVAAEQKLLLPPLSIYGHLPNGVVGEVVSYQYTMSGGVLPRTASIASGALPAGLSMDASGLVTGTRTTTGNYTWAVHVTDADGSTVDLVDSTPTQPAESLTLKPKVTSWWDFESSLIDLSRGGNNQAGTASYVANGSATGNMLAAGTVPLSTATASGFNYYVAASQYSTFAFGARLSVSMLANATNLLTVGSDSGSAVAGVVSIGINASGKWTATVYSSTGTALASASSVASAAINTDTHVGVNMLVNGTNNQFELRINGATVATSATFKSALSTNCGHFVIGTREGTGYQPKVSEMFWAHDSLTDAEWAYLYNSGAKRFFADFGNLRYSTTYDVYLTSLMASKSGGIYKLNDGTGTTAVDSATFGPIGSANLLSGAAYSTATSPPPAFGADAVVYLDGINDRVQTPPFTQALGGPGVTSAMMWFKQSAVAAANNSYFDASWASQPLTGRISIMQGADATKLYTRYNDFSGNAFPSGIASTPSRLNDWNMLSFAGFSTNYAAPVINGIVMASPMTYTPLSNGGTPITATFGSYIDGTSGINGYLSRSCICTTGNFSLPQLAKLYDLGMGNG